MTLFTAGGVDNIDELCHIELHGKQFHSWHQGMGPPPLTQDVTESSIIHLSEDFINMLYNNEYAGEITLLSFQKRTSFLQRH